MTTRYGVKFLLSGISKINPSITKTHNWISIVIFGSVVPKEIGFNNRLKYFWPLLKI